MHLDNLPYAQGHHWVILEGLDGFCAPFRGWLGTKHAHLRFHEFVMLLEWSLTTCDSVRGEPAWEVRFRGGAAKSCYFASYDGKDSLVTSTGLQFLLVSHLEPALEQLDNRCNCLWVVGVLLFEANDTLESSQKFT